MSQKIQGKFYSLQHEELIDLVITKFFYRMKFKKIDKNNNVSSPSLISPKRERRRRDRKKQ